MKKTKVLVSLVVLAFLFSVAAAGNGYAKNYKTKHGILKEANRHIKTIDCTHADKLLGKKGVIFLDVREPAEYKAGHIQGAINVPRGLIESQIASKIRDKGAKIIVYCKSGERGALATYTLKRMGYKNAENLEGGWLGWQKYLKKKNSSNDDEDDDEDEGC